MIRGMVKMAESCHSSSNGYKNVDINSQQTEGEGESQHEYLDGGFGWVIVVASFFNSFIFDGIASSFGVLYPHVLQKYQTSAFVTSFAGSMLGAYLIMGSAAAELVQKFGFRAVSCSGGFLACVAFVLASICPNIYLFLLTYGVMGGLSVGLVYIPSMVIVNGYFNKKRGITNGIISSGSGMGLLVMAPLTNCLLDMFTLSGTVLMLAGVMLNICVFSACFRKPKFYENCDRKNNECDDGMHDGSDTESDTEKSAVGNSLEKIDHTSEEDVMSCHTESTESNSALLSKKHNTTCPPLTITQIDQSRVMKCVNRTEADKDVGKSDNFVFHEIEKVHSAGNLWRQSLNHLTVQNVSKQLHKSKDPHMQSQHSFCPHTDIGTNSYLTRSISKLMHIHQQHFASSHQLHATSSRSKCHSLHKIPNCAGVTSEGENVFYNIRGKPIQLSQDCNFTSHESIETHASHLSSNDTLSVAMGMTPLGYSIRELLTMVSFHMFWLGACLIQFGYPIASIFLADLAASHGIPSHQGAIMISLIGSFNIGGRLLAGFLANLKLNPIRLNNAALLLAAVLCFLCPLFTSMWSLCLFASLYGFLLGFFPPLQPLIIVKYFGISSLASTFGFVTSLKGVAGLMGPPLAGWIYDVSSDYSMSIAFAGVAFLLSVIANEALMYVVKLDSR